MASILNLKIKHWHIQYIYNTFLFFVCFSSGGNVLQIPRVQLEDAGKYTCQAVNEAGEDKMHYDLEVLGKEVNPTGRCLWPTLFVSLMNNELE